MTVKMASNCCRLLFVLCFAAISYAISPQQCQPSSTRSFTVDYHQHCFLKDGCPFHYVSGSIHYNRVPRFFWTDRLAKMAAAGLDAIQIYVPWNVHESQAGVYDFSGQQDLEAFVEAAHQEGLLVILRAGPYICGEWDFGGLPAWLLQKNGSVVVRTMDPGYIAPVDRWLGQLLPRIRPLLYANGGPIIMVQVENEYGSYFACDHGYMNHLENTFRAHLGDDIVLFTTDGDGAGFLKCGTHPNLLTTVDFGPSSNVSKNFDVLRKFQPDGPLVNSEFYTGWLDYWGSGHAHGSTNAIVSALKQTLDLKASVNMYMFEGGTNFGYTNGADPPFNICPTSYDYDAPLTESGDTTNKYMAIRKLLMQYKNITRPVPSNMTKRAYGPVPMTKLGSVLDLLGELSAGKMMTATYPKTMEQLGQSGGFILYRTTLKRDYAGDTLSGAGVRDRAHIMLDGHLRGLIDRKLQTSITLTGAKGQTLDLLIENQGHINFGTQINNGSKGLISNVTFGQDILSDWSMYPLNISSLASKLPTALKWLRSSRPSSGEAGGHSSPAVYTGVFSISDKTAADTFLNVSGWFKGQAFVNGFNLGRYWPVRGPQLTLYVPASVLHPAPAANHLLLMELDHAPCDVKKRLISNDIKQMQRELTSSNCAVRLVDKPVINGPSHPFKKPAVNQNAEIRGPGRFQRKW